MLSRAVCFQKPGVLVQRRFDRDHVCGCSRGPVGQHPRVAKRHAGSSSCGATPGELQHPIGNVHTVRLGAALGCHDERTGSTNQVYDPSSPVDVRSVQQRAVA